MRKDPRQPLDLRAGPMLATETREARKLIAIVADAAIAGRFRAKDRDEAATIQKALGYFGRTQAGETLMAGYMSERGGADRIYANGISGSVVGAAFRRLDGWIVIDYGRAGYEATAATREQARAALAKLFPAARLQEIER